MEGSGKTMPVDQADPKVIFGNAGLPAKAGAVWVNPRRRFGANFRRDAAAATKYWRAGADFLSKLPKKPQRTKEQQLAADLIQLKTRGAREDFLARHAGAIYRKLTKNFDHFLRVDELAYDAAKMVPGLTPTRKQVDAEAEHPQGEKDGVEVDQGISSPTNRPACISATRCCVLRRKPSR
jgi:(3,5-dihydroxyphenyl)acetyl-CoA 1,2-dioxygenase